jgi:mono/diheme cytochrome c family protein
MRGPCRLGAAALLTLGVSQAQNRNEVLQQGEQVFAKTCGTGYCHGAKGAAGGAPRLAGRHFDQAYIASVVTRGIPGTAMTSFATSLPRPDLVAVIAYVADLNGATDSNIGGEGVAGSLAPQPALTGEAATGALLFKEAVRGFGRCSTCHEVAGAGISVAAPIVNVPASAAALKALTTPNVKTASMKGESMPALVLSEGKQGTIFYDLTSAPPVQRNAEPGSVKFSDGSNWRHASFIGVYTDSELSAVLAYLRAVVKP